MRKHVINFRQNLYYEDHAFAPKNMFTPEQLDAPPTYADISGIELRLTNVQVKDNNTPSFHAFPVYARIYLISVLACSTPTQSLWINLKGFDKVDNGDALHMDKSLFCWSKQQTTDTPPGQMLLLTSLVKCKQPLVNEDQVLYKLQQDPRYRRLTGTLESLLKDQVNGADISNVLFTIAGIIGGYLGKTDEKPLFSWLQGFSEIDGANEVLGKTPKMAANRHVSLELSLVIKDKERMETDRLLEQMERQLAANF